VGLIMVNFAFAQEKTQEFKTKKDSIHASISLEFEQKAKQRRELWLDYIKTTASDTLQHIDGSNLYLYEIPDLTRFKRVNSLNLQGNKLTCIPSEFLKADSLRIVQLGTNQCLFQPKSIPVIQSKSIPF
jgi:hypothetical protein